MLTFRLTTIKMSDGTVIQLPDGLTVIVGPNNSGKSAALRNIRDRLLRADPQDCPVVVEVQLDRDGIDAVNEWLEVNSFRRVDNGGEVSYERGGIVVHRSQINAWWPGGPLNDLSRFFVLMLDAIGKISLTNSTESYDELIQNPQNPVHLLFADPSLEATLSDVSKSAFGIGLVLNRHSGSKLHLHFGEIHEPQTWPMTESYRAALHALPLLEKQGDGVRSLIGMLLAISAQEYPLLLIDEPEAFLHPPQARLAGRKLAELAPSGTQAIVATHSSDVLQGLLSADPEHVQIIRLTRSGAVNPTAVLDAGQVKALWSDPLLRHSNILDGLFHEAVVLCEADGDCRFYAALLERVSTSEKRPDLLFTHCGGKDRMPVVLKALRAAAVPVRAVADIDVLDDEVKLRSIVDALGGNWDDVASDAKVVRSAVNASASDPFSSDARTAIEGVLNAAGPKLGTSDRKAIREAIHTSGGWRHVQRGGLASIPQGEASAAAGRLVDALSKMGLFVVPVGTLERWVPEVGNHGPRWVLETLSRPDLLDGASGAREFMSSIVTSLGQERRQS